MHLNFHRLAYCAAFLTLSLSAYAVPANPRLQPTTLPDGSVIMTQLRGDESKHVRLSAERLPIERASDGFYYYMTESAEGSLRRSNIKVSEAGKMSAAEKEFVSSANAEAMLRKLDDAESSTTRRKAPRRKKINSTFPLSGSPRGLVILVEYSDVHFTIENAHEEFSRMLNEEGYSDFGGTGSARDWFIENSSGKFTPQFDVAGPVRLSNPMAYYGENMSNGDDIRAERMVIEACQILDDEIDFTQYDEDNDGFIDNIFVFYAGYGENLGGDAPDDAVWPHSWDIAEATSIPYLYDGVRLNHYACTNEKIGRAHV